MVVQFRTKWWGRVRERRREREREREVVSDRLAKAEHPGRVGHVHVLREYIRALRGATEISTGHPRPLKFSLAFVLESANRVCTSQREGESEYRRREADGKKTKKREKTQKNSRTREREKTSLKKRKIKSEK